MKLNPTEQAALETFCNDSDHDDRSFTKRYSGRGMFGKECIGIRCSSTNKTLFELGGFLAEKGFFELADYMLNSIGTVNLGLDYIIYFSNVQEATI